MRIFTLLTLFACSFAAVAQENLPIRMTLEEKQAIPSYLLNRDLVRGVLPPSAPVRTPAQWEEQQGVVISWKNTDYDLLSQIVDEVQEVAVVYVLCSDSNSVKNYLNGQSVPHTNVEFIQFSQGTNSIWARDYSANTIYENEVTNPGLVDWTYNRPRPRDDTSASKVAAFLNLPIYETKQMPNYLVHTGGNFMSDGHGTAFSSELVLDENGPGNTEWDNNLDEAGIDSVMKRYLGIERYVKMETLPYDGIHHIDMHMKLLDEETLLVGEYPTGISDGPQIEENIDYVTNNFLSCFGRPYKVVRIPQPPSTSGNYPGAPFGNGLYRTYTNALIVNGIVLVPSYYQKYDTVALRIWQEAMPGYKIIQLDCNNIIASSGTIHCITHEVGVNDPIWISHAKLWDTYQTTGTYAVDAYINTQSGVSNATLHWTVDTTAGYAAVAMNSLGDNNFQAMIPAQAGGTDVFYFIEASSNSGRTNRKPYVAPKGVFKFTVMDTTGSVGVNPVDALQLFQPYPVPANDRLTVSFYTKAASAATLTLTDMAGRALQKINLGSVANGVHHYAFDVTNLPAGNYLLHLTDLSGLRQVKHASIAR